MADEFETGGLTKAKQRKNAYFAKLQKALDEYKNVLIITVDFVGSGQLQQVRLALRGGKGQVGMGKNTIMRKVIRDNLEKNPSLEVLLPYVVGNIGFVFTNGDLNDLRKIVVANKVPAAAKTGVIAPVDVVIPAGPTGLDPGQTSFFQTLNISTKIVKGAIDITTDFRVCEAGKKVTASAVALLNKLNIKPFEFGIVANTVYENGSIYDAAVLEMSQSVLCGLFCGAAARLAALSFALGHVNTVTIPHAFGRTFKILAAVGIAADYEFEELKIVKEMIANPGAFAPATEAAPSSKPKPAPPEPEEEEEEDAAPAADLFGGGGAAEEAPAAAEDY